MHRHSETHFAITRVPTDTPPPLPLTLPQLKAHLRLDPSDDTDDDLLMALQAVAVERAAVVSGRCILEGQFTLTLDGFGQHRRSWGVDPLFWGSHPHEILLPCAPVVSVDSIAYVDPTGATQSIDPATCDIDLVGAPARLRPPVGTVWPQTACDRMNTVAITFTGGYISDGAGTTNVPPGILTAIKLIIAAFYENRSDTVVGEGNVQKLPRSSEALLRIHRVSAFGFDPVATFR